MENTATTNWFFNLVDNAQNLDFQDNGFTTFGRVLGGGMAVQRPVAERWQEVTKTPLVEAYGLTETSPAVGTICLEALGRRANAHS